MTSTTSGLIDQASQTAGRATKSAQRAASDTFDELAGAAQNVRKQAGPMFDQANALAQRGADAVRGSAQQMRDQALRTSESMMSFVKAEPIKAILIAAAAGAVLMAMLSFVSRAGDR